MNIPAVIDQTAMPTVQRLAHLLKPRQRAGKPEKGSMVALVDWSINVNDRTNLIDEGECRALVMEINRSLAQAGRETATKLAKALIGGYRAKDYVDPDITTRQIISVFETVPLDIGRAAVDFITRNLKWPPVRADVHEVCERMVAERVHARKVAEAHLEERTRRQNAEEKEERDSRLDQEFRDQHKDALALWRKLDLETRPPFAMFAANLEAQKREGDI